MNKATAAAKELTRLRKVACSFPMELRCKAIEAREDTDLCALLMATATELERLRAFARSIAEDDRDKPQDYRLILKWRQTAAKMLEGAR